MTSTQYQLSLNFEQVLTLIKQMSEVEKRQLHQELAQELLDHQSNQWPDIILSYEGISDFPAFESYRDELIPLCEMDLF
ncbi:hypothetical protein PN466_01185 [Roseofilum reptotaenium CS-1145]|uniref:DUF2281 domain-containing protein n=1 Tax=Roseofilum reptotaenium AO1-A TaxID=1925591 RepID=A0A1L9QK43_9CYAN|nr:hypothetical protein [Roseofilum reptotaenium]MDB9515574.1 hypothetical protein [Roseofilum reptotaenium CS-1145]OJJ15739.1 hypothetical protein BI308_24135 [Roseofilum reptotaenium AO1-A]